MLTASNMVYPACIINGAAVTKTFQILYRNEEVRLDDVINFRLHAIVETGKVSRSFLCQWISSTLIFTGSSIKN